VPILHKILLGVEIYAIAAASLVALSVILSTVRTLTSKTTVFNYPADVPKAEAKAAAEGYFHKALVALDIFLNVLVFAGRQGETISTHSFIASQEKKLWGRLMNWWLDGFQTSHGPQAASGDLERASTEVERLKGLLGVK
jgi:hypothetical protein